MRHNPKKLALQRHPTRLANGKQRRRHETAKPPRSRRTTMRTPKRHVFEFPFEIPASKTARSGRPRAKHVQHNNASEQLDHQLQIPQRETNVNPSASERAAYRAKRKNLGLCSDCSNQTEEGKRYCPSCSKIRDERIARLRNGRKDLGLCQDCGEPAISGLTRCSPVPRGAG